MARPHVFAPLPKGWRMVELLSVSPLHKQKNPPYLWQRFALVVCVELETGELHRPILIRIE